MSEHAQEKWLSQTTNTYILNDLNPYLLSWVVIFMKYIFFNGHGTNIITKENLFVKFPKCLKKCLKINAGMSVYS